MSPYARPCLTPIDIHPFEAAAFYPREERVSPRHWPAVGLHG
jgi:hypothetical protein